MSSRVLLIDDDASVRKSLSRGLRRAELEVVTAADGGRAIELLEANPFDVVLSDLRMPGVDGLDLLRFSRSLDEPPPFILFSAFKTDDVVAEAMREGAEDFLDKPVDLPTLVEHVHRTLRKHSGTDADVLGGFIGHGTWYQTFATMLRRIARTDATVLIEGETGTGKSLVARSIWHHSLRCDGPYVVVNCAAIPDQLLESELFGHVKGAFTGASNSRIGKIQAADQGILFLDEIGELKGDLQAKLLQVLQERSFQPVGSNRQVHVNVRFVAATNRNLWREVQRGSFRGDLYHRLNVVKIEIPPLRHRAKDIPALLSHFRHQWSLRLNRPAPDFSDEALENILRYGWPGNVRELENLVERAFAVLPEGAFVDRKTLLTRLMQNPNESVGLPTETTIPLASGRQPVLAAPERLLDQMTLNEALELFERQLLEHALQRADGNRSEAARLLGIKRTTLLAKLKRLQDES